MIHAEGGLEFRQQAAVEFECLAELAPSPQIGAVGVVAQQGHLVLISVALFQQRACVQDQPAGIGGVTV